MTDAETIWLERNTDSQKLFYVSGTHRSLSHMLTNLICLSELLLYFAILILRTRRCNDFMTCECISNKFSLNPQTLMVTSSQMGISYFFYFSPQLKGLHIFLRWNQQSGRCHKQSHLKFFCKNTPSYTNRHHVLHTSSQYGAGLCHWLHLGRFGACSVQSDAVITGWFHYCNSSGFCFGLCLQTLGGSEPSREQIKAPFKARLHHFRSACST